MHPHVHPGPPAHRDRDARRGHRRRRAAAPRRRRRRACPVSRLRAGGRHRASHRAPGGRGRARHLSEPATGAAGGCRPHRPQAVRRDGLPGPDRPVRRLAMPLLHDIAHLGHAELLTPEPDKSLWFFTEVLGLTQNGASGDSVYLRTWDDYEHHSLKLTAAATSGIRRTGMRAASEEALQRRVAAIEAAGLGLGWQDGDVGIGPTYLFCDPDGHELELYFETERYQPAAATKPALKNQAQAYPGRGVGVRRLDHVNFLAAHSEPNGRFVCEALGGRVTEQIVLDDGTISAQWLHFAQKSYDLVYTNDWTGCSGRL